MSTGFAALAARLAGPLAEVRGGLGIDADGGADADDGAAAAGAVVLGAIAEPGDGVLGRLVALLGPAGAAELVVSRPSTPNLVTVFRDAGESIDGRTARAAVERWVPRIDPPVIVAAVIQAGRVGARFLIPSDRLWPSAVDDLGDHAPFGLWVRGRPDAIAQVERSIALVGARAASGYGELVAGEAAAGLHDRGLVVVSGGAYGIDGAAHRAVLRRKGTTVAFLAGGVDRFYPTGHDRMLTEIAETGAVLSEMPCGAAPTRWRFLQRNRLIAASTTATVVLEAGLRSGSLNTAGHAAALGRALGAVPGPVTSPSSAGCHRLLREYAAVCVTNAAQMAELVTGEPETSGAAAAEPSADETRVLDALSTRSPRAVDDVARRAGLPPRRVMSVLGGLDVAGRAAQRAGGWVARSRSE